MSALHFRRAQPQDGESVLELMRGLYAHYDMAPPPQAQDALRETLEADDLARIWLMEADEGAVGYAVLTFGFSLGFGGRYGLIDELYIVPARRGQGLGTQALTFMEEEARRLSLGVMLLEADRESQDISSD